MIYMYTFRLYYATILNCDWNCNITFTSRIRFSSDNYLLISFNKLINSSSLSSSLHYSNTLIFTNLCPHFVAEFHEHPDLHLCKFLIPFNISSYETPTFFSYTPRAFKKYVPLSLS